MKIPAATLSFFFGMALSYLMGAFIGNSFNIGNWTTDGRFGCMMMGVTFGGVFAVLTVLEMEKSK